MMYQGKGSGGKVKIKRETLPNISIPEGEGFTSRPVNESKMPTYNLKNPKMRDKKPARGTFGDVRGGGMAKGVTKRHPMSMMSPEAGKKFGMEAMKEEYLPANEEKSAVNKLGANKKQNRLLRRYMGGSNNGDS